MKKLLHLSSVVLLLLLGMGVQGHAQKGSFAVQLVLKETDCINNKVIVQVQVKANHADSTFNLGDANFRFRYSSLAISNPAISPNAGAVSANPAYSLNLQGSTQGATNGLISLNVQYAGQLLPTLVTTNWLTVADLQFDLVSPLATNCVDLTWQTDKTPPVTGMGEIIVTTTSPLTFTNHSVKASGTFNKLILCPSQICQNPTPATGHFGVQLLVKKFDCITKKVQVEVQVKAKDANTTFSMGDANFRFNYNASFLSNPIIFSQNNYSGGGYAPQDLQGSGVSGSTGLVSLNVKYGGSSIPTSVPTIWTSVAVIEFTFTGDPVTPCFDLSWKRSTDVPATGMNQITVTGQAPFTYTSQATISDNTYNSLTLCPDQYCTPVSTGSFGVHLLVKSFDCVTKKVQVEVQVKAKDINSTFLMGDANFRFNYNASVLSNPVLFSQNNYAGGSYTAQNLQGSGVSGNNGLVSLNVKYGGSSTPSSVGTNWTSVGVVEFTFAGDAATACFDLTWQKSTDLPATGMNQITVTGQAPFTYTSQATTSGDIYNNLTLCPSQYCTPASTGSYAVQLVSKSFDCVSKKAVVLIKVRAKDANSTFLMGDANFRFNYNTTLLANPKIVQQANFATNPYTAQDLQGSSVSGTAGIVSLNVKYAPGNTPTAQQVTADWVAVACIEFDFVGNNSSACFDLNWQTATSIPKTGMNEVKITGNSYTLTPVASANVFEKLTICPTQLCQERTVSLSITKTRTSVAQINLGDVATFKLVIKNTGPDTAINVVVVDSLPASMQWVGASPAAAFVTGNVATWTLSRIAPNDSAIINVQAKAIAVGVSFNKATIVSANGKPLLPPLSDDACVTVPMTLCSREAAEVSVPAKYTNVIWYRTFNGNTTQVGTGNIYLVTQLGSYTFTATDQTCPASGCCPIVFIEGNCCPADLCIPFVVKKTKQKTIK